MAWYLYLIFNYIVNSFTNTSSGRDNIANWILLASLIRVLISSQIVILNN